MEIENNPLQKRLKSEKRINIVEDDDEDSFD